MKNNYHVIIVGSGLAGLAAADILSRYGLQVLIIDDNAHIGGQLLRKPPHVFPQDKRFEPDLLKRKGTRLATFLQKGGAKVLNGAQVLGIYPGHILLVEESSGNVAEYRSDAIVVATGARERQLPFKGWTLPGVISTGAAQILIKSSGILPGRKTLIGGCGPLILALASEILTKRGEIQAVLDHGRITMKLKALAAGPAIWPKLLEGAVYLAQLAAARIPMKHGVRILEARGRHHLEKVVVAHVDTNDCTINGTEKIYSTDTLAIGYGFSPNIELPQQAGCSVSYAADKGGWHVDVDASMATTEAGIYAAGEITGIAGGGKALIEGRIAAWDILYRKERINRQSYEKNTRPLKHQRFHHIRYGRFLNHLCRLVPDYYENIPDETTICRCEEISMGEIRRQLHNGFKTMNGIKKATRCGMGNCQGRICGPILFDILSAHTHRPPEAIGCSSARAPVKTVALGALAKMRINISHSDGDKSCD